MTYVQLEAGEFRPVQVQMDDGVWAEGLLEGFRKVEGVWSGYVRYSLTPDETHHGWFEEPRIRGHVG
jgi:hypothetical protein